MLRKQSKCNEQTNKHTTEFFIEVFTFYSFSFSCRKRSNYRKKIELFFSLNKQLRYIEILIFEINIHCYKRNYPSLYIHYTYEFTDGPEYC